ncbi:hypothetical protein TNIN_291141 [Trichonephila inaurata madagascariensis]|uniref:Uncharacterized protein n=1 Tax=Trichonephila inaurata madagascariensis TaxID=2747483 RepID=A0A8X7BPD9_9ARAC|nr:hypothetical protein TNIN_291141 [Trichonephila inaurata madagascariensis]
MNRMESHKQIELDESTATTLVANKYAEKISCIFCDNFHSSQDCQTRVTKTKGQRLCVGDVVLFFLNLVILQKKGDSMMKCLIYGRRLYTLLEQFYAKKILLHQRIK